MVRLKVTLKDWVSPAARVSVDGLIATVKPSMPVYDAVYVAGLPPTLVTRRVTVCTPAMSPMAIDAVFRLLGSSTGTPADVQNEVGSCVPHRKPSQSLKPASNTSPGLAALLGCTWPAPWRKISTGLVFGAGVPPSSTSLPVVIRADLIAIGDQLGWSSLNNAARPATWGLDMDVPLNRSNSRPLGTGDMPARMS